MSRWRYRYLWALHSRMPSMMEAWFSSSDRTASSGVSRACGEGFSHSHQKMPFPQNSPGGKTLPHAAQLSPLPNSKPPTHLKQASVGIETAGIEDGILAPVEAGYLGF